MVNKHNNKKKLHTHGERRGVFEIREYFVENTAHVRVVTFISYTDVIYIYILFRILKKLKKTHNLKKYAQDPNRITKNKSGTIYLVPPPYYIEINKKNTYVFLKIIQ